MRRTSKFLSLTKPTTCSTRTGLASRPSVSKSTHVPTHSLLALTSRSLLRAKQLQIILFSATFPDHVRSYAAKIAPNANKIELQKEELSVDNIRQFYMDCRNAEHKYDILVSLYQLLTIGQSIIFCQVRCALLSRRERDTHLQRSHSPIHDHYAAPAHG